MKSVNNDRVFDPHFRHKFEPRKDSFKDRTFKVEIVSVGETVEKALLALAAARGWCEIHGIDFQEVDTPCKWYVRFWADGTSMKAAGEYLTGGVIVTWWK